MHARECVHRVLDREVPRTLSSSSHSTRVSHTDDHTLCNCYHSIQMSHPFRSRRCTAVYTMRAVVLHRRLCPLVSTPWHAVRSPCAVAVDRAARSARRCRGELASMRRARVDCRSRAVPRTAPYTTLDQRHQHQRHAHREQTESRRTHIGESDTDDDTGASTRSTRSRACAIVDEESLRVTRPRSHPRAGCARTSGEWLSAYASSRSQHARSQ
jgi:hypothetical protein